MRQEVKQLKGHARHIRGDTYFTNGPCSIFVLPNGSQRIVKCFTYKLPYSMGRLARVVYLEDTHPDCFLVILEQSIDPIHPDWEPRYNDSVRFAVIGKDVV